MATYLVTYDLNKEVSRPPIVDHIKSFGTWAKLSESSYAIVTSLSAAEVYATFAPFLDGNDNLYAISLSRPYSGQGDPDVNQWLANNL